MQPEPDSIAGTDWVEFTDDAGTPYFYNNVTQESVWEQPAEMKAALDAAKSQLQGERVPAGDTRAGKEKMWAEATAEEQRAFTLLGYTQSSWDDAQFNVFDHSWESLSAEQKRAAATLGASPVPYVWHRYIFAYITLHTYFLYICCKYTVRSRYGRDRICPGGRCRWARDSRS